MAIESQLRFNVPAGKISGEMILEMCDLRLIMQGQRCRDNAVAIFTAVPSNTPNSASIPLKK